ncbi:HET-domain-containing protein [Stemphylium lycopersici]|uniref:HET-domain-containing protein n=1 Tax=Stemphylium lycopersici TaxID=183478 RepID=A0A364NBE6_STELY|nr:HET-domain-containing protein [Stemphylium lycopersici]RAR14586.1 HET-domain-containing protein [Stemphylium lycopersici]
MTSTHQPPFSLKKRSLPEVSHELARRPRKMTRSTAKSTQAKSTSSPPPYTPRPTERKRTSNLKGSTSLNGTNMARASEPRDDTSVTPQFVLTCNTRESPSSEDEAEESSPPIILSKFKWASQSSVKIPKLGLYTPTGRQSETPAGANWAGVIGQVSKMYCYTRLPENRVRLLLIKPGTFDEQLNASLMTVHDEELGSDKYPYAALSYNWGNGEYNNTIIIQDDPSSQPVKSIKSMVDALNAAAHGKMLKVKPNLYEALKHLRKENEVVGLWVDALCINQFDIKEKEEQVLKMPQIYQKAYNVNIWLGSDHLGDLVSDRAMAFIPKVIDPDNHTALLIGDSHIESWASLYDLLKWSWFSRRWIIQELAFAQSASVHCGKHVRDWSDFQTAIAIFHRHFDSLKGRLMVHYESSQAKCSHIDDDSTLEIEHLGAKLLVDMTSTLFRKRRDGSLESTKSLESLVCSLSGFDTSDPRDAINALRSISKEVVRQDSSIVSMQKPPPAPNYGNDLFEVYRDFVEWVVANTASIDIICRHWALKERNQPMPTTPRLVRLPSWILFVEDSAWGKGEELFRGRKAGDSFVGLPGSNKYNACGRNHMYAEVKFPQSPVGPSTDTSAQIIHDMSLDWAGVWTRMPQKLQKSLLNYGKRLSQTVTHMAILLLTGTREPANIASHIRPTTVTSILGTYCDGIFRLDSKTLCTTTFVASVLLPGIDHFLKEIPFAIPPLRSLMHRQRNWWALDRPRRKRAT